MKQEKKRINVYLTNDMFDVLKSESKESHMTMSAYMNMCFKEFLNLNDEEYLKAIECHLDMQMDWVNKRIEYIKKSKK